MWTSSDPRGTTALPYLGDFVGSSQTPLSGCHSTSHGQILTNALRIRLVSIYGNGAGRVRGGVNRCRRTMHVC